MILLKHHNDLEVPVNWRIDVLPADVELRRLPSGLIVPMGRGRVEVGHNAVLDQGIEWVLDRIQATASGALTHMARGSGSTAVTTGDTGLETETERDAVSSTVRSTGQVAYQYVEVQGSNNGQTFREAGLIDAASGGTLFNRWVHTQIDKTSDIQILYSVTLGLAEVS